MDDEDRKKANKQAVCQEKDTPDNDGNDENDNEDDCPIIYDMGGDSEMLLNRGVSSANARQSHVYKTTLILKEV